MSINRLISIKNPILNALDILGADRAKDLPTLTTWAIQAEQEIKSHYALIKEKKIIDIHGCKAELPCNAVVLQCAIIGAHDCSCNDLRELGGNWIGNEISSFSGSKRIDYGGFLIIDQNYEGGIGCGWNNIDYEIQGNKIVFYRDLNGKQVTIQYLGTQLDEDGFPMIGQNHVRAITEFICWQYCKRSKYSSNPLPNDVLMMHQREWNRLCSHARADDAELSPSERNDIVNIINDPHAGRSVSWNMDLVQWNRAW